MGVDASLFYELSADSYRLRRGPLGRFWLRARMYGLYPFKLLRHCRKTKNVHARVVCSNTFYAPLIAALAQKQGSTKVIHLVYDLFPDALFEAGVIRTGSAIAAACDATVRKTFRHSSASVFLGKRLLSHAESRFGAIRNSCIIPVGADGSSFAANPPRILARNEPIDVLYCGNLGRLHDANTLIDALTFGLSPEGRQIRFCFHSSGHHFKLLEDFSRSASRSDTKLELGDFLSGQSWIKRMQQAHVGLVTMRPGAERVLMPSKTYSALVAGQALLAICPRESDLADLVTQYECGWVVAPGNASALISAIEQIRGSPEELQRRRENAFRIGHSRFSSRLIAKHWKDLFDRLDSGG